MSPSFSCDHRCPLLTGYFFRKSPSYTTPIMRTIGRMHRRKGRPKKQLPLKPSASAALKYSASSTLESSSYNALKSSACSSLIPSALDIQIIPANKIKIENDDSDREQEKYTPIFTCRICKDGIKMNLAEFRWHYKMTHKDKKLPRSARAPFVLHTCEICAKNFKAMKNLKEHMETHNNQYDCELCKVNFKKVLDYTFHMRTHSEDGVFRCIYCDYVTQQINDITLHLNIKHETKHRYTCKICNKGFDVLTWFKEHDNFHSGAKPFICEYCGKSFPYSRYLSAHKTSMHKEVMTGVSNTHECVICKKKYQHKNSLKLHMNVHTGNVAICEVCGKQLSSKEKLKFHMRIHTGYKPFKCAYCEKSFTKKPILVEHERIHTGERPYICDYCSKAFSQRSSLVIHVRGHTGERPYVCHVCSKGFVARAMLNIHFRTCKGYYG